MYRSLVAFTAIKSTSLSSIDINHIFHFRLDRGLDQGFGFSVLWTRPPRVERVDSGRAAERAGLYPGDYIVFVDRHNVVTMPESQVLTLIKWVDSFNIITLVLFGSRTYRVEKAPRYTTSGPVSPRTAPEVVSPNYVWCGPLEAYPLKQHPE